ncbi:30S ribosome-binding factor RbfA [Pseudomonas sp. F1_0610]|uniref:30S ribosome-binding factor RbfA n=1 Tax=Pseudomonas sp. F1_0610 TaxID=3114284 RepID=UPI0039C1EFB9
MAKQYSRTQRVGDQIQRELAMLISREVKDPRLGFVTVTGVDVTRDIGHAKVFVTIMGENTPEQIKQNLIVLNDSAGFLRSLLGKVMKLRSVPQLHFHYDATVTQGAHLSALIEKAVAADRRHQPVADDEE